MKNSRIRYPQIWELPNFNALEFRPKKTNFCICIPIKNEGDKFKTQILRMQPYTKLADIIILDWGSTDQSTNPQFLKKNNVRVLLTKISPGKQSTQLRMGFAYALRQKYEGIIQIDGNNKDGVQAIPSFIEALNDGFDYVQGSRFIKGGKGINTPLIRDFAIRFIATPIISIAAGKLCTDITNGFRAYSKKYLLNSRVKPFRSIFVGYNLNLYLPVRALQLRFKTKEIPVIRKYPKGKVPTKINFTGQLGFLFEIIKTALGYYHPVNP